MVYICVVCMWGEGGGVGKIDELAGSRPCQKREEKVLALRKKDPTTRTGKVPVLTETNVFVALFSLIIYHSQGLTPSKMCIKIGMTSIFILLSLLFVKG